MTFYRGSDQNNPQEEEMINAKWLSKEALGIAEKEEKQKVKEKKIYPSECRIASCSRER